MERTLEHLNAELEELRARLERRAKLLAQWEDLRRQQEERRGRERTALSVLQKEQSDVDELERLNPKSIWLRLTGDIEARASREEREVLTAQLQYDQALRDLEDVERRKSALEAELEGLEDCAARYEACLGEKRALLRASGGPEAEHIVKWEEALRACERMRRELGEALGAGREALSALDAAGRCLDEAEDLGAWDLLGGGLLVTMAKHEHIDEARSFVDDAQRALSRFRTELADVQVAETPQIEIGAFETFADYFFDGLFADLAVQEEIEDAGGSVARTVEEVERVMSRLEAMDREEAERAAGISEELKKWTEQA